MEDPVWLLVVMLSYLLLLAEWNSVLVDAGEEEDSKPVELNLTGLIDGCSSIFICAPNFNEDANSRASSHRRCTESNRGVSLSSSSSSSSSSMTVGIVVYDEWYVEFLDILDALDALEEVTFLAFAIASFAASERLSLLKLRRVDVVLVVDA